MTEKLKVEVDGAMFYLELTNDKERYNVKVEVIDGKEEVLGVGGGRPKCR